MNDNKKLAFHIWTQLPGSVRTSILRNVWCGACTAFVAICDYDLSLETGSIVLKGFCGRCGHRVARVIEVITDQPRKAIPCSLRYFIFNIWLNRPGNKKILRQIQMAETKSLYNFARVITKAFGFCFDHCFGYYDRLDHKKECQKAFELFVDIGEEPTCRAAKGVKRVKLAQAFKKVGDKLMFLFDYGDQWEFHVELKDIRLAEKWDLKPVILKKIGKAPLQYPPYKEEFQ